MTNTQSTFIIGLINYNKNNNMNNSFKFTNVAHPYLRSDIENSLEASIDGSDPTGAERSFRSIIMDVLPELGVSVKQSSSTNQLSSNSIESSLAK